MIVYGEYNVTVPYNTRCVRHAAMYFPSVALFPLFLGRNSVGYDILAACDIVYLVAFSVILMYLLCHLSGFAISQFTHILYYNIPRLT